MLDKLFNELWEDGYIYNEPDENGHDMSYGEYAAVENAFEDALLEEVKSYTDFEEAADKLKELTNCSDDVRIFFNMEEYDNFNYYINDDGTIEMWSVPETLKDFFEGLKEEYEEEHRGCEDEEEDEYMYM